MTNSEFVSPNRTRHFASPKFFYVVDFNLRSSYTKIRFVSSIAEAEWHSPDLPYYILKGMGTLPNCKNVVIEKAKKEKAK